MSNPLRNELNALAASFAESLLDAIRTSSLAEILEVGDGAHGASISEASVRRGPGRPKGSTNAAQSAGPSNASSAVAVNRASKPASARKPGRLARRSIEQLEHAVVEVTGLLWKKPGLRSEEIRTELGMDKKELPRVIQLALENGTIKKKGQKRATTYSAA
jgi:hypothetical protein